MVAAFGFFMYEDTANAFEAPTNKDEALDSLRAIQAKGEEAMLIQILAIGALWMICVSLVGVVGHEKWFLPVAAMRKLVLRIYLILLLVTLFAFIFIVAVCVYLFAKQRFGKGGQPQAKLGQAVPVQMQVQSNIATSSTATTEAVQVQMEEKQDKETAQSTV